MKNILILCTGNSCRSQMAHGYLEQMAKGLARIYSAGIEAHGVNRIAIMVMKENGIDISGHSSNCVHEYSGMDFDHVITVCNNARERCPVFPSSAMQHHYDFDDPAKATGGEEAVLKQFRKVRDEIKEQFKKFAQEHLGA